MSNGTWGVIAVSREALIVDADSQACRLLRRSRKAVVGAGLRDIVDAFDRNVENAWSTACGGEGFSGELRLSRTDGTVFLADVKMETR